LDRPHAFSSRRSRIRAVAQVARERSGCDTVFSWGCHSSTWEFQQRRRRALRHGFHSGNGDSGRHRSPQV
jgi:hypothetical protein